MKLSLVIPTRDRAPTLEACLQAVDAAAEGLGRVQVIVVDDGSEDETADLLRRTSLRHASLVTDRTEGAGPAAARNLGWRQAQSDLVLFTGDDIIADRQLLRRHLEFHAGASREQVLVGTVRLDPSLPETRFSRFVHTHYQFGPQPATGNELTWSDFHTANASVKREMLLAVGGFDERFRDAAWEDVEFAYRLHQLGARFHHEREAIGYHRHAMTPASYAVRQERSGRAAALLLQLHPELAGLVGARRRIPDALRGLVVNRLTIGVWARLIEAGEAWMPEVIYTRLCSQLLAYYYYRGLHSRRVGT